MHERNAVILAASDRYRKLDDLTRQNEPYTRILLAESMRRAANSLYRAMRKGGRHGR